MLGCYEDLSLAPSSSSTSDSDDETSEMSIEDAISNNSDVHDEENDYTWDESEEQHVTFNTTSIRTNASGVSVDGTYITITSVGTYKLTGELENGQVIVNADDALVRIILSDVSISNNSSACINIKDAEKTIIVLEEGSENSLSDAYSYSFDDSEEEEPNATIFSKDNLTITGDGQLTLTSNYNDAINSKDGLVIAGGEYIIESVDDGLRGKDYIYIKSGTFTIDADGDCMKSDNDEDESLA